MDRKLRVVAVGAGYFSQFQYQGWRNIDAVDISALTNRDLAKGQALAARYGVPRVYGQVEEMLDVTVWKKD